MLKTTTALTHTRDTLSDSETVSADIRSLNPRRHRLDASGSGEAVINRFYFFLGEFLTKNEVV